MDPAAILPRRNRGWIRVFLLATFAVLVVAAALVTFRWRDMLWVLAEACVADERVTGGPWPCVSIDHERGFVLVGAGAWHLVLVPTTQNPGIESPLLLAPDASNYWDYAWQESSRLKQPGGAPVPRDLIGLAVNSAPGRTEDQLHIHIGCLRPDVAVALERDEDQITTTWSAGTFVLANRAYQAMRVVGASLAQANPFQLLATLPAAAADMGAETLVVVGATFKDDAAGFVLLARQGGRYDPAVGEKLLDYGCAARGSP